VCNCLSYILSLFCKFWLFVCYVILSERNATKYGRLLASSCRPSGHPSVCVCNAVHCGSQGRCTGLITSVFLADIFLFLRSATIAVVCIV